MLNDQCEMLLNDMSVRVWPHHIDHRMALDWGAVWGVGGQGEPGTSNNTSSTHNCLLLMGSILVSYHD